MLKSLGDVFDGECSAAEYAAQYNSVAPEVGGNYVQHPGTWQELHFKIVFVEDKVALGVATKGVSVGRRQLFYSTGIFAGWKLDDTGRPSYRLQNIKQ